MMLHTDKIFKELQLNLIKRYIFYVPSSLLPDKDMEDLNETLRNEVFDTIAVILDENTIKSENYTSYLLHLYDKPRLLEQNLFRLLDCKVNLQPIQFDHLLERYSSHLNSYAMIADKLNENLLKSFPDLIEGTKMCFKLQAEYFNSHLTEVSSKFQIGLDQNMPTVSIGSLKEAFPIIKNPKKSKRVKKPKTIKKPVDLTNEAIDNFLLQTVFHIDKKHFK